MNTTPTLRKATDAECAQIDHALLTAIVELGQASTDDAHALFELPPDVHPSVWGARAGGLQARQIIRAVGRKNTDRQIAHGREIKVFEAPIRDHAIQEIERLEKFAARRRPAQRTLFDLDSETK